MAINQALIQKGESSVIKIVKFKGETTIINGHSHTFKVYTDDSVEIFDYYTKDDEGRDIKHKHIYVGDYPNGYILKDHQNHVHSITSVAHPIMFQKDMIGKRSGVATIDREFKDLYKKAPTMDVDEFFEKYQELFYEIPAEGPKSHQAIMEQSKEYITIQPKRGVDGLGGETGVYVDPKDEEILSLTEDLLELQKQVDKQGTEAVDDQHPIFQNGSFLRAGGQTYYMQLGKKRKIKGSTTYDMLKRAQGHPPDRENEKIWIEVTEDVLKGIDTGPEYTSEDINVDGNTSKKDIEQSKALQLDPDDFNVNPENYQNTQDYLEAVDRELRQKSAKEDYLESKRYEYQRNLGARGNKVTGPDLVDEQKERLKEITIELNATREAIIRYSKILRAVDPDGNLQNIKIDTSQLKDIVTGTMTSDISSEEKREWRENVFLGQDNTDRMSRFIEGYGEAETPGPNEINDPESYFSEQKPSSPPTGYQNNSKSTLANRTVDQMARYSKIGQSSPKKEWYWGPKKAYENKLKNSNPALAMVSMFVWEQSNFEWISKHDKRMFQGRVVDNIQ